MKLFGNDYKLLSNTTILISIPLFILLLWGAVFSNRGVLTRLQLASDEANMKSSRDRELFIRDSLKNNIQKLKTNKQAVEAVARERYMMTKPGETVYIVKEK